MSAAWKKVAIATAALAGATVVAYALSQSYDEDFLEEREERLREKRRKRNLSRRISVKGIHLEALREILDKTQEALTASLRDLAQKEKSIKAKHGDRVNVEQLRAFLLEDLEKTQQAKERNIHGSYGVTAEAVRNAIQKFKDDPAVAEFVSKTKSTLDRLAGPGGKAKPVDIPTDLTPSKLITIMEEINEVTFDKMTNLVQELCAAHGAENLTSLKTKMQGNPMIAQEFQMKLMQTQQVASENVLAKHGIKDPRVLNAALKAYQSDPELMQSMMALQQDMQKRLREKGLM